MQHFLDFDSCDTNQTRPWLLVHPYIINFHRSFCKSRVNGAAKTSTHRNIQNDKEIMIEG